MSSNPIFNLPKFCSFFPFFFGPIHYLFFAISCKNDCKSYSQDFINVEETGTDSTRDCTWIYTRHTLVYPGLYIRLFHWNIHWTYPDFTLHCVYTEMCLWIVHQMCPDVHLTVCQLCSSCTLECTLYSGPYIGLYIDVHQYTGMYTVLDSECTLDCMPYTRVYTIH